MESMVTDPEIQKVIMVCDQAYVDKTDERAGGVGTEAQIISGKIYSEQEQEKFVAVVTEHDEDGKPCVPTYYRSRIHIDMTDESRYGERFDQLLRWAHDQPLHLKPELGEKPAFLSQDEDAVTLATTSRHRRAMDALINGSDRAIQTVAEYFSVLTEELEKLRLGPNVEPFDKAVIRSIEEFLPYRNQAIEIFLALSLHVDSEASRSTLHHFLEGLIPYTDRP